MKASIYARTSRSERGDQATTINNQITQCRELARLHNVTVNESLVFTDVEAPGTAMPDCWASDGVQSRPALSALVESAESPGIDTVVVHRLHVLGTSSDVLLALLSFFQAKGIRVITQRPEQRPDPAEAFAAALLKPCAQYETDDEMERRRGIRRRKLDEIERLRVKLARLEAEIAED